MRELKYRAWVKLEDTKTGEKKYYMVYSDRDEEEEEEEDD